jgi:FkbM family methyltransferase
MDFTNALAYRRRWAGFGVFYGRRLSLRSVKVAGRRVVLRFPDGERAVLEYELGRILFDDCYRLQSIERPVHTVVDIGANVGFFAIAARHQFPGAAIHCFEPNPRVWPQLHSHADAIGARVIEAAVGFATGHALLDFGKNSLHTTVVAGTGGATPVESFQSVVDRLGPIDLLKLDCEGAEWEIFRCTDGWRHVHAVAMEYHLWAKTGSSPDDVRNALNGLGFGDVRIEPSSSGPWGFAWARR